jgi:putative N-acetylmannosamine-6-phosphate epimerase
MPVSKKEYCAALARVAERAGVSAIKVEASFRASLKKSKATASALFLPHSVITLRKTTTSSPRTTPSRRPARSRAARGVKI